MRPHKQLLIVSPNQMTGSVLAIQFRTWGYDVKTVDAYNDAAPLASNGSYDLVLLVSISISPITWRHLSKVAEQVDAIQRSKYRVTRILDAQGKMPEELARGVDRIVTGQLGTVHLREMVRLAVARKRGPRPKGIVNLRAEAA
jgi:hypothetical protein